MKTAKEMRNIHERLKPTPWIASDWGRGGPVKTANVAWSATDSYAVTGPGIETARWLLQCCQRGYEL